MVHHQTLYWFFKKANMSNSFTGDIVYNQNHYPKDRSHKQIPVDNLCPLPTLPPPLGLTLIGA